MHFNSITFIGGIHGVGKSTVCQHICDELKIEYLSASKLLKWEDINEDVKNKKVRNVTDTQNRLISGLANIVKDGKQYLLDGHYCLLGQDNEIKSIPLETFKLINPLCLNLILGDISVIKKRIEERDNKIYDYSLLENLQFEELHHAKFLSRTLGITLNIGTTNDYSEMLTSLQNLLKLKVK